MNIIRIVILLGTVAVAHAQVPGMFPWWEGPIAREIGLSEEQHRQVRATVDEYRSRLGELRRTVNFTEEALRAEMDRDVVDTARAGEAIDRVVRARCDLTRAVSEMGLRLRLTLTAAQWQQLQERERRPAGPPRGPRARRPGPPEPGVF